MRLTKDWFFGFVETNGFFNLCFFYDVNTKCLKVKLEFRLFIVNIHDFSLLVRLHNIFGSNTGRIEDNCFVVDDFNLLFNSVLPFFEGNTLKTTKRLEFIKFKKALYYVNKRKNSFLNQNDLETLCKLKEEILRFRLNLSKDKVQKS